MNIQTVLWHITRWSRQSPEGDVLKVGSRVKTKYGWATVAGGAVHVRLDIPNPNVNGTKDTGFTFNIGKEWE